MFDEKIGTVKDAIAYIVFTPFFASFLSALLLLFITTHVVNLGASLTLAFGMTGLCAMVIIFLHLAKGSIWPGWGVPLGFVIYVIVWMDWPVPDATHIFLAALFGILTVYPAMVFSKYVLGMK